jgi:hypothetical protein
MENKEFYNLKLKSKIPQTIQKRAISNIISKAVNDVADMKSFTYKITKARLPARPTGFQKATRKVQNKNPKSIFKFSRRNTKSRLQRGAKKIAIASIQESTFSPMRKVLPLIHTKNAKTSPRTNKLT